jgi:hypothetical protein
VEIMGLSADDTIENLLLRAKCWHQETARSADLFRSGSLNFELFNDGGFRNCVPLRHQDESRATEEGVE